MGKKKETSQSKTTEEQNEKLEDISPEVAEVIRELPLDKRQTIVKALSIKQHYSGPLPDGENIRIYNEVIPNGGDRLMKTVEKQLDHRITIEKVGVRRTFNQSSTGQWMGFFIAVIFGIISWDLAKSGQEIVASILGTVDLVALVTIFITGRRNKN